MVCGMDEAGLLNSMTAEQLRVTCDRLVRSCNDMEMLLNEFQDEQVMLRREQDRLHQRIEKVTAQLDTGETGETERGAGNILWNLISDVDKKLEVSHIFRAKEERKAAKRRKNWSRHAENAPVLKQAAYDEEDHGPFSDMNVQKSWGCDISLAIRQPVFKDASIVDLDRWVKEAVCGDPVAEAFEPPELQIDPTPSPHSGGSEAFGFANMNVIAEQTTSRGMWSPRGDRTPPGRSPPPSARRPDGIEIYTEEANDAPAPQTFSRQLRDSVTSVGAGGAIFAMFQSQIQSWTEAAEAVAGTVSSRNPDGVAEAPVMTSFTVVLRRVGGEDKWGLHWVKDGFTQKQERVVEKLVENSVADMWNKQQEQCGHPERCIQPMDRLASVNGKTGRDEMRSELTGQEVVLEFQRMISHREWLAAQPKSVPPSPNEAGLASSQSSRQSPRKDKAKGKFGDAFSAFLEANAPSLSAEHVAEGMDEDGSAHEEESKNPEKENVDHDCEKEADISQIEVEATDGLAAPCYSKANPEVEDEAEALSKPQHEAPYGVVVQVLSRTSGSLRLSWMFDWKAAPSDILEQSWARRGFEVLQKSKASTATADQIEQEEEVRIPCLRPQLALELPVGRLYTFLVCAVLTDTRAANATDESTSSSLGSAWSSPSSTAVSADLRGATARAQLERDSPTHQSGGSEPSALAPVTRSRGTVASRLGSFLDQSSMLGVGPSTPSHGALPSSASPDKKTSSPSSPSGLDVSNVSGFSESDPPARASVVMGGSVANSRPTIPKPELGTEPRDITERLRKRRERLSPKHNDRDALGDRQHSMDSDEEDSMFRLSSALSILEKTAAAKLKELGGEAGEAVAQEGHHTLHQRLDSPRQEPAKSAAAAAARSSAAAAAAGAAMAGVSASRGQWHELPIPVARPAQDFADDPGWANLTEPDAAKVEQENNMTNATVDAPRETVFKLRVQLADDRVDHIKFIESDDVPRRIKEFVEANSLRPDIFESPLLEHVEMMAHTGKQEDSVDIADLLE